MKRSLLILACFILIIQANGQKSVDALFKKYAGRDGYTSFTVSGNLLKFSSCFDAENDKHNPMPANITEIRILSQEDKCSRGIDFYSLIDNLDLDDYDEFMKIRNSGQDLRMLVRAEGKTLKEFLLIAGGNENALIQIKGKMTISEAKKFSRDIEKKNRLNIDLESR